MKYGWKKSHGLDHSTTLMIEIILFLVVYQILARTGFLI